MMQEMKELARKKIKFVIIFSPIIIVYVFSKWTIIFLRVDPQDGC